MLISTLAEPPGLDFTVRGLVVAHSTLGSIGGGKVEKMVQSLIQQADRLGADAIVDTRTIIGGDNGHCVMTGTAVCLDR